MSLQVQAPSKRMLETLLCGSRRTTANGARLKAMAFFLQRFSWFPITVDQLTMLLESNVCDSKDHFDLFEIEQIPYNTDTLSYLKNY